MGTVTKTGTISADASSHDTTNYSYASVNSSYPISNAYHGSSNTSYTQINWKTGQNAETYIYLKFDLSSIPANATITSVSAKAKAYVNTTNSSRVTSRQMQLAAGTTLKGSALTISNSTSAQTFTSTGSWTRAEVVTAGVRFYVKRGTSNTSSNYYTRIYGADITVTYSYQATTYTITVSNTSTAVVTADPSEPEQGASTKIKSDIISGITVKDNGTDVTSQFVQETDPGATYSVTNVTSTYGFALNANGYYESNNKAHASSAAVCRVDFSLPVAATITFSVINYAEATYDYGQLSNLDTTLTTNASADTTNVHWDGKNNNSASVQTVTYTNVTAGNHYIYVKYFKDQYTDSNNDSLQFKVAITLTEPYTPATYWAYTISNVQADHTILVAVIASDKILFKNNGSWVQAVKVYKKVNGSWVEQSDLTTVFDPTKNYVKG